MNILAVSTWFPYPPDNGSKARAWHLLKHLGERHALDLLALRQSDDDLRFISQVECFCRRHSTHPEPRFEPSGLGAAALLSPVPRYFRAHHSPGLQAELDEWLGVEQYGAVIAVTLGAAPYVARIETAARKVLDEHNVESRVIKRQASAERSAWKRFRRLMTWVKAERYECMLAARFDAVSVVSHREQALFRALMRGNSPPAVTIPNGVDPALLELGGGERERGLLLFTGALSYGPNRDAAECLCRDVLPLVRRRMPDARARVTGRVSEDDRRAFEMMPGVEMTGYVDDIRREIVSASVVVAPFRLGGGTRLKILEAMAAGTPVVSTPVGAEGIPAAHGRDILLGQTPEAIAAEVVRLLCEPALADRIARNARDLVREHFQWPAIASEFERLVTRA